MSPAEQKLLKQQAIDLARCRRIAKKSTPLQEYKAWRRGVEAEGHQVTIIFEQYYALTRSKCYYNGFVDEDGLVGIDRINSNYGYHSRNCRPCCWKCNRAKSSMPDEEFLSWIHSVQVHMTEKGGLQWISTVSA
jgi:hypothetical protein